MGVASWSCVVWIVEWVWAGWGSALAEGRAADCRALVCGVVGLSGAGMRDTPAAACWVVVGAPACVGVACCRGSGAVRPGCLACLGLLICWGLWVGVGGLVVNCIVDASILL